MYMEHVNDVLYSKMRWGEGGGGFSPSSSTTVYTLAIHMVD